MPRLALLLIALLCLAPPEARAQDSDIAHIEEVLGLYMRGHETGVLSNFERAFHPDARMYSTGDEGLNQTHLRTWWLHEDGTRKANGTPAEDEANRHRRIINIDVSGPVATAKLELDYPGAFIYDYMTLVRTDGRWQIITKAFSVHPKGE